MESLGLLGWLKIPSHHMTWRHVSVGQVPPGTSLIDQNMQSCRGIFFNFSILVWVPLVDQAAQDLKWKTSFEKELFSAWASTLNIGLINKG